MSSNSAALAAALVALCPPVAVAEDLGALVITGQRGQSLEQTRRDRYECHNWSLEQTGGSLPPVRAAAPPPSADPRELRQRRIDRAIVGAAVGGAIGGLLGSSGRGHDTGEHAIVGAAAGAAIGAASAGSQRKQAAAPPAAEAPSDYLRALTACLEGRGYSVALPAQELTARR